ncbi:DNA invertase [Novosphingobium indicum]|uniref:DNA invertase n=1 Tax=Novosphingobium indicum TaxID=462949 RepID=A0ABQ2K271_9SPHN|nr:recombinase family protein [Novosphingobium indicum]GGN63308.1 DNA invertase [Novosphingobium indicum]
MKIGYARVSTTDQSLDIQRAALLAAGVAEEHLFCEKVSGRTADDRPELQRCLSFARSGDTILATKLDRFARSARDLHNLLADLDSRGVGFQCLDQAIDTTSSTGRLTLSILGAVAEFELAIRAERQRDGIAAAKNRGTYRARKSAIDVDRVRDLSARGMKPEEAAAVMGISRASVYRALATIKASSAAA